MADLALHVGYPHCKGFMAIGLNAFIEPKHNRLKLNEHIPICGASSRNRQYPFDDALIAHPVGRTGFGPARPSSLNSQPTLGS